MVILGSIGGQFEEMIGLLLLGTILASFVWFYTLSIGAAKLGPTLSKPKVKRGIDMLVAAMMFTIAFVLTKGYICSTANRARHILFPDKKKRGFSPPALLCSLSR